MAYLRKQAQENLQHHIHGTIPELYEQCMVGTKRNLRQTLEIGETTVDPKTKLHARAIANDIYQAIINLGTNGVVVSDAIRFVQSKQDGESKESESKESEEPDYGEEEELEEGQEKDTGELKKEGEENEERTTNDIF